MRAQRVIVIGAGLAGLSAARELAHAGAAVTVVEGRSRAGGRVWTVPLGDDDVVGELGGEFIDADHREMHRLADAFGLRLVPVLARGFVQRYRSDAGGFTVSRGGSWRTLQERFAPLVEAYRSASGRPESSAVRELATFSVREWLRRTGASREVHAMADALRGFFLADPDELSAFPLVQQLAEDEAPAQRAMARIDGGNARLIDALVADTPARMLFECRVTAIAQTAGRVVCTITDSTGRMQELEGEAAIVTVPATTLRRIEMTPPLPESHATAIRRLAYGPATKVLVRCSTSVFDGQPARAFATDTHLGAFWDSSEGQTLDSKSQTPNPKPQRSPKSQSPTC